MVVLGYTYPLNQASVSGLSVSGGPEAQSNRGWQFVVDAPSGIVVHELCQRTPIGGSGPNTNQQQTIVLYNYDSGAVLAAKVTEPDAAANGNNGWRCQTITSRTLNNGFEGLVTVHSTSAPQGPLFYSLAASWRPTGAVRFVQSRVSSNLAYTTMPTLPSGNLNYGMIDIGYSLIGKLIRRASYFWLIDHFSVVDNPPFVVNVVAPNVDEALSKYTVVVAYDDDYGLDTGTFDMSDIVLTGKCV
jgi:hypothetical protein